MGFSDDFLVQDVNLDGFEIVRSQYFLHKIEPAITIWNTAIAFNSASLNAFGNIEYIQIMVNNTKKCIILRPATSKELNTIAWKKKPGDAQYCRLECALFAKHLYDLWHLDETYRYRLTGRLVQYNDKPMILYDFQNCETWKGKKLIK